MRVVSDKLRSGKRSGRNGLGRSLGLHAAELQFALRVAFAVGRLFDKLVYQDGDSHRKKHEDEDPDGTLIAYSADGVMKIDADDHRMEQIESVAGIPSQMVGVEEHIGA
jgi:hypothetical protein